MTAPIFAADFAQGMFKPHGSMELHICGPLNILEAEGPFNRELIVAADAAQGTLYDELTQKGQWGTVLIFHGSALITPDAVAEISKILKKRVVQGYIPVAVALVFGPELESENWVNHFYLEAYETANIKGKIFNDFEAARQWVQSVIDVNEQLPLYV